MCLPTINKQSSEFLQENPLDWTVSRKRLVLGALLNDDTELAKQLVEGELVPRIGLDWAMAYLGRIFEKEITPKISK